MRPSGLVAAFLAFLTVVARAGVDEELAKARAEFEAIVQVATNWRPVPNGPSLTRRVRQFLSHAPSIVRQVEADALEISQRDDQSARAIRSAVRTTVRFLHGLPTPRNDPGFPAGREGGLDAIGGAIVLVQALPVGPRFPSRTAPPVALPNLVENRGTRPPPSPRASELLAAASPEVRAEWSELTRREFGMALGESFVDDEDGFAELMRAATTAPDDPALLLALGWSGRAAAGPLLSKRLTDLAAGENLSAGGRPLFDPLCAAAAAFERLEPAAFAKLVSALPPGPADDVVGRLGFTALVRRRLAVLDGSSDAGTRRAALARICNVDPFRFDIEMPPGADAVRLVRILVGCVDSGDAPLRGASLEAAEALLYAFSDYPIKSYVGSDDGSRSETGESVGSCAGPESTLRSLLADLEAGRIEFRDAPPGLFGRCVRELGRSDRIALTDAPAAEDASMGERDDRVPVRLSGTWTKDGLRLRVRNESEEPIAVDTAGLRYGTAAVVNVVVAARGKPTVTSRRLRLQLGIVRSTVIVPAAGLVVLAPNESCDCDVPVREALRGGEHVDIEFDGNFHVVGESTAPVARWRLTPVR